MTNTNHKDMANAIRFLAVDAVENAKSGHPGLPMGVADIATVLFNSVIKIDHRNPDWFDRDRFILSAGHGSMLIYALNYLLGYEDMTIDQVKNFRQLNSVTPGHPEYGHTLGVEMTTGPLGQGIASAVGMAISERHLNAIYGDDIINHMTWVIAGDGCLMEGISQEAISLAGHLKLSKLVVLWDDNQISIDGSVSLSDSTDQIARFQSANWETLQVDGHDPEALLRAMELAKTSDAPTLIACKTKIGYGAPNKEGTSGVHGAPLGAEEIALTRKALGWEYEPFEIPTHILDQWRVVSVRNCHERKEWEKRISEMNADQRASLERRISGDLPSHWENNISEYINELTKDIKAVATRKASETVLNFINEQLPETIGGSADLTGSNNTKGSVLDILDKDNFEGRYIHYGIREHGMAAAMNGMALHGGVLPYGGTFLVFSDYSRPSIRLAALMGIRVIHVMTHDSIGLGEDGPTHQPVEHLASLRAIPNLNVFRPADLVETAECWQLAVESKNTPSVLALTRQNLPLFRTERSKDNKCAKGAYVISGNSDADVSIFATGSEVEIALEAAQILEGSGTITRVISVPCFELFMQQSSGYQKDVIGHSKVKIGVEAAIRQGWSDIIGKDGIFVGMDSFGASAPYQELYAHFGITAELIAEKAKTAL